jgi:hypothetical protein
MFSPFLAEMGTKTVSPPHSSGTRSVYSSERNVSWTTADAIELSRTNVNGRNSHCDKQRLCDAMLCWNLDNYTGLLYVYMICNAKHKE